MSGWWWDVPEFVAAQQDEGFKSWVIKTEYGFELYESDFDELVPELDQDYYREGALLTAEAAFLRMFPDRAAATSKENLHKYFQFVAFIGHMYTFHLECTWVYQPKIEKYGWYEGGPAIECPWDDESLLEVMASPRIAAIRRKGNSWDFTFKNNRKNYLRWVEQGRPPV